MSDRRRYYDHESAYQHVLESGGSGWDDFCDNPSNDSYLALQVFLSWPGLDRLEGRDALELGCGGGQGAFLLEQRGFRVTGIDYAPTAIVLARANAVRHGLTAEFQEGDCLTLDGFPDQSKDLVVDNHVFHCIIGAADRAAFLSSIARVLKPGGLFFSETMSCEGTLDPDVVKFDPHTRVSPSHSRFWVSEAELRNEYRHAGLRVLWSVRRAASDGTGDTIVTYATRGDD